MALTKIDDRGLKTPIDLLDNEKIRFGTGNDLEVFHDGSNSKITNATGNFIIEASASGVIALKPHTNESGIITRANGASELYYDNSKKFETNSNGIKVTGRATSGSLAFTSASNGISLLDNGKVKFGGGDDLQIYHDGSNSYIKDTGTGDLIINASTIRFKNAANDEHLAIFDQNNYCSLYYDNVKKFETTSDGVKISDAILEIADTSCHIDLMETSATNHRIRNGNGNFYIQKISDDKNTTTTQVQIDGGTGAVNLYHNGAGPKFETYSSGIKVTGVVRGTTSGFGIDFAETSNASGMTSEVLDDYEEGTWTCGLFDASSGGNEFAGYTGVRIGKYTKIGDTVTAWFYARTNGSLSGITSANQLHIQGLPFTCSSDSVVVAVQSSTQATAQSTIGTVFAELMAGSTYMRIKKNFGDTSNPYSVQQLLISEWEGGNGANIKGTITYKV